ncbi:MAG TPA: VWA domain-containing protein [Thermoanaerobaculia bacterium]|jgi:Ca-activated chloride channel family protein|nr:VWA domain-containing protein [Thermoanaerobaculia bacterium]
MNAAKILTVFFFLASLPAQAVEVRIVQPGPGEPILGEVEVRVEVLPPGTPVERVEVFLDGAPAGVAERAPFRILVDAGEENREHKLEAVARTAGGAQIKASVTTPKLQADAEVQVELQQLFVTVHRNGKPVLDLTREDFKVFDQDVEQPLATYGRGDAPFTAVLLVDASSSMAEGRLEKALDGARAFFAGMGALDQAKLMLFSDHILLETPFTSIQPVLTLGLRGVTASGGTALNDALYLASKRLETRRGRKIAVLLSDGVDVESVLSIDAARAIARRQVTLYWLRLRGDSDAVKGKKILINSAWRDAPSHQREIEHLRAAVLGSGGRIADLAGVEEIPATLTALLSELRDQYVLGITPRRTSGKGAWHPVRVEVRGGLVPRTQDGYFEP